MPLPSDLRQRIDADFDGGLVSEDPSDISAEHGIGLLKKAFLSFTRSEAELAVMRSVKRALDPNNILNPGKIFDP